MLTKGQYRLIGQNEQWKSTLAMVGLNGRIYTCDENGSLYWIEPQSEKYTQLGQTSGWRSRLLMVGYQRLFSLEESGTFFSIDPDDGTYAKIGTDGQWASTKAATVVKGKIYTCDQNGKLYVIDPWTSEYKELGSGTWSSQALIDGGEYLVTLEESGSFYRVNIKDGTYELFGNQGGWAGTLAVHGRSGSIFACGGDNGLYSVNMWNGQYEKVAEGTWHSRLMTGEYMLYSLEHSGNLYEIAVY